jgi:hypothetical protein
MRRSTAVPAGLPWPFVNVASKGFKFTVGTRLWREGHPVIETASGAAADSVGARYAVHVFPARPTRLLGAQHAAPLMLRLQTERRHPGRTSLHPQVPKR